MRAAWGFRNAGLFVLVPTFIVVLIFLDIHYLGRLRLPSQGHVDVDEILWLSDTASMSKSEFVAASQHAALTSYDQTALKDFCGHDKWSDNVEAVKCLDIAGGIGNVKLKLLACLRRAMEDGNALLLPTLVRRPEEDLLAWQSGNATDFGYMFDRHLFVNRIAHACPRMRVFETEDEVVAAGYSTKDFPMTMATHRVCHDPPSFVDNFGKLLVFKSDVLYLAYAALHRLSTHYGITIDPRAPIARNTFLGIHLRTERDAVNDIWEGYNVQSKFYLGLVQKFKLPVTYIASGDKDGIARFGGTTSRLWQRSKVVTKRNLLHGQDLKLLDTLAWDQQALVDYLILQKASFFGGTADSSYSWSVAYTRRLSTGDGVCGPRDEDHLPKMVCLEDDLSKIFGEPGRETFWRYKVWP